MKSQSIVKIIGEKEQVDTIIEAIEIRFYCVEKSKFKLNDNGAGGHVFLTIIPLEEGI